MVQPVSYEYIVSLGSFSEGISRCEIILNFHDIANILVECRRERPSVVLYELLQRAIVEYPSVHELIATFASEIRLSENVFVSLSASYSDQS